jgi:allophanate hydrolase subunit 1
MASKIGYNTLPIPGVTVTIPGTTTLNIQLNPGLLSPSNVNAVLNMTQTSTNISWNNADNIVELMYDNMIDSECLLYQDSLSFSAVKFIPPF